MSTVRTRFFDDYRLSRIDEEADRLSLHSNLSCSLDAAFTAQRSASADGTLQCTDDYDNEDYQLPPPPPQLTIIDNASPPPPALPAKRFDADQQHGGSKLSSADDELSAAAVRALQFMQAKYDSLGKVKVEKPSSAAASVRMTTSSTEDEDGRWRRTVDEMSSGSAASVDNRPPSRQEICYRQQQQQQQCASTGCRHVDMRYHDNSHATCSCRLDNAASNCYTGDHHRSQPVLASSGPDMGCNHRGCCRTVEHERRQQPQLQQQDCVQQSVVRRTAPLTTAELFQVDLFYRSHKTIVHVSTCTATLYICADTNQSRLSNAADWKPAASGIPVVMLDQRRGQSHARLYVVLAERGTGFELWRQVVDRTDQYAAVCVNDEPAFHVVSCPSDDGVRRIGLHFDDPLAASEFHRQLLRLADVERTTLTCGKTKKAGKGGKGALKTKKRSSSFSKADISQPCCFTHVTRLERDTSNNTLFTNTSSTSTVKTIAYHPSTD